MYLFIYYGVILIIHFLHILLNYYKLFDIFLSREKYFLSKLNGRSQIPEEYFADRSLEERQIRGKNDSILFTRRLHRASRRF